MKTYIAVLLIALLISLYNAWWVPHINAYNQHVTALLRCVNGTTFAVSIDGTYYVIQCQSMEVK